MSLQIRQDGNNNTKRRLALAALLAMITLGVTLHHDNSALQACVCEQATVYQSSLPASHPQNRCANDVDSSPSWHNWLTGSGHSLSFHYLDLLELLTRNEGHASEPQSR